MKFPLNSGYLLENYNGERNSRSSCTTYSEIMEVWRFCFSRNLHSDAIRKKKMSLSFSLHITSATVTAFHYFSSLSCILVSLYSGFSCLTVPSYHLSSVSLSASACYSQLFCSTGSNSPEKVCDGPSQSSLSITGQSFCSKPHQELLLILQIVYLGIGVQP